ncbi:2247_t:CDS:2 [Ambispora gerdemannii]|uniref:2247_t:CDS:1 n=1 Tax=Ambispora gerdemannii TaxID=144530 RepID=A0A9N8ZCD9_9GLOM|nr:2247_t:CDS:2 [Ambispora gerdemannii]
MVKSNNYNGLNPVIVQALNNLQYRYSDETPEMWCSRVRYPFKKLLEYNPKYFSKNGFIQMVERLGDAHLIFIALYATPWCLSVNKHLNECISKTATRHLAYSKPVKKKVSSELSDDEIEIKKSVVYRLINSAKVIQWTWRAFKLRPKSLAKQVWEAVRNDRTPDRKRFLGILSIPQMKINPKTQEHALHVDEYLDMLKKTNSYQYFIDNHNLAERMVYKEYINYCPSLWIEKKKSQLSGRLDKEAHYLVKEKLEQKGYRQAYIS